MLSRLREHLGAAGLIVAIVALVAALAGGAIAANSGGKATASAKGKQGPRGKTGKTGPAGPAGPAGAAGAAGPQGPAGPAGEDGANGKNGKDGKDGEDGTDGAPGAPGQTGPEGNPWTHLGVLPAGETETGTWAFGEVSAGAAPAPGHGLTTSISFPIPLAAPLGETAVHYLDVNGKEEGATSTKCLGTAADPKALPGNLCVYTSLAEGTFEIFVTNMAGSELGAERSGALLVITSVLAGAKGTGTWAVTAPAAP